MKFEKFHGTGNDFIIIDNREGRFDPSSQDVAFLCQRRFGIGSDGLLLLESSKDYDFKMVYFNADGKESTMCGNGGRCIVRFAHNHGIIDTTCTFEAVDGVHEATVYEDIIKLKMTDVHRITQLEDDAYELFTGSPHFVRIVNNVRAIDVHQEGMDIRYSNRYKSDGINVNFVQSKSHSIEIETYERGVEDITYSCGTGAVASALAANVFEPDIHTSPQVVETKGGKLKVYYEKSDEGYINIFLEGPAVKVFEGELEKVDDKK